MPFLNPATSPITTSQNPPTIYVLSNTPHLKRMHLISPTKPQIHLSCSQTPRTEPRLSLLKQGQSNLENMGLIGFHVANTNELSCRATTYSRIRKTKAAPLEDSEIAGMAEGIFLLEGKRQCWRGKCGPRRCERK